MEIIRSMRDWNIEKNEKWRQWDTISDIDELFCKIAIAFDWL